MERLLVTTFATHDDALGFARLIEFANDGQVLVGWKDVPEDDPTYEHDADSYDDNVTPEYDETDRSDDPRYPLANMLAMLGGEAEQITDEHAVLVYFPAGLGGNEALLDAPAAQTGLAYAEFEYTRRPAA